MEDHIKKDSIRYFVKNYELLRPKFKLKSFQCVEFSIGNQLNEHVFVSVICRPCLLMK